jgi:hypothetical protein
MKNLFFLSALFLLALSITACSDDDDNNPSSNELVGSWKLESMDYTGTSTTDFNGSAFTSEFMGTAFDIDATVSFSEDPNEYNTSGGYKISLTYDVQGQSFEQEVTFDGIFNSGSWSRTGDVILVTNPDGETQEATIITLNDNELVMESVVTEVTTSSGATSTIEVDQNMVFSRQ